MLTVILHIVPLQSGLLANGILCLLYLICCRYEPQFPACSAQSCGHLFMCSFMLWGFGILHVVTIYLSPLQGLWCFLLPTMVQQELQFFVTFSHFLTVAVTCSHSEKCILQGSQGHMYLHSGSFKKQLTLCSLSSYYHSILFCSVPLDRCYIHSGILEYTFISSSSV